MEGTREFNLHRKSFKGRLDHSLQISEGHSLEDGDRFFCQHPGAELRLRRGRDWPKMRKNSIITTLCKATAWDVSILHFIQSFLQSYQLDIWSSFYRWRTQDSNKLSNFPKTTQQAGKCQSGIQTQVSYWGWLFLHLRLLPSQDSVRPILFPACIFTKFQPWTMAGCPKKTV